MGGLGQASELVSVSTLVTNILILDLIEIMNVLIKFA